MTIARAIIDGALEGLGVASIVNPASPETLTDAVSRLRDVILELESTGYRIDYRTLPTELTDDIGEPDDGVTRRWLEFELALKLAGPMQVAISREYHVAGGASQRAGKNLSHALPRRVNRGMTGAGDKSWRW